MTQFAAGWLAANFNELFNDLILLRGANFRPNDLSSIWSKKDHLEIFHRLANLHTRNDAAQYARTNGSMLVVTLAECTPFLGFLAKALPGVRVIHVVRNAYDVAHDVAEKKWFSDDQLVTPAMAQLYTRIDHDGAVWHLPWWVGDEDQSYFIKLTDYERGIYYWCSLMERGLESLRSCPCGEIFLRYEDLVIDPQSAFDRVAGALGLSAGPLTTRKIAEVQGRGSIAPRVPIDPILEKRIREVNGQLAGLRNGR